MRKRQKQKLQATALRMVWMLSLICFVVCSAVLLGYLIKSNTEKNKMKDLAGFVTQPVTSSASGEQAPAPLTEAEILARYQQLAQQNPDMVGWVSVEGTALSYPVMQTPQAPEYYLRRDFERQYALSGTPFADAQCNVNASGENVILYGHNMKNKTMFSILEQYQTQEYYAQHPLIRFDTLSAMQTYRVFALLEVDTSTENPDALAAYQLLQNCTAEQFDASITYLKENSKYDTGITPVFGDSLLTLSTCTNKEPTGRFVLVAVKSKT